MVYRTCAANKYIHMLKEHIYIFTNGTCSRVVLDNIARLNETQGFSAEKKIHLFCQGKSRDDLRPVPSKFAISETGWY